MTASCIQRAQASARALEASICSTTRTVLPHCRQRRQQVVGPGRCNVRRGAQFAPELPKVLDVRYVIFLKRVPQARQPLLSNRVAHLGVDDDGHEGFDGAIDSRANPAGTAVDLLNCRRQFFQEQHGTLGSQYWFLLCHAPDFGERFLDALDRGCGLPAEPAATQARRELLFISCSHRQEYAP